MILKKILLPIILLILAYGFWISPAFKEIAAGVAIFLFGMLFLEEGFKAFTGGMLERILAKSTNTTLKSLSFGMVSTTLMQSSSLVSVVTISFLSAGLISLVAGIGIIFGANIGTTTGAWLVASFGLKVDISAYAMPMLVFGIVLNFQKSRYAKGIGSVLAGLGFLFLGIHYMKEGFEVFKGHFDLSALSVDGYAGLFLFAGIGALATVVMQSSHATMVLILTALASSQITYDNALALAIGANVGTTITALISAIGANVEGRRLAGAHLLFNVITGLIAIAGLQQFMQAVDWLSLQVGIAADNYTQKLAMFHTLFNLTGVLVMTPFIKQLAAALVRYLPARTKALTAPKFLNSSVMDFPETMLTAVKNETWHLLDSAFEIIAHGINLRQHQILGNEELGSVIAKDRELIIFDLDEVYENKVKTLYAAIIEFTAKANAQSMPEKYSGELLKLSMAASDIVESVKDIKHLRKNTNRFMLSHNSVIQGEYNQLRLRIATILRQIYRARDMADDALSVLELDELKVESAEADMRINRRVSELLRKGQISSMMATSLLNDSKYAQDSANKLISITQTLLTTHNEKVTEVVQEVMLSPEEVEEISRSQKP